MKRFLPDKLARLLVIWAAVGLQAGVPLEWETFERADTLVGEQVTPVGASAGGWTGTLGERTSTASGRINPPAGAQVPTAGRLEGRPEGYFLAWVGFTDKGSQPVLARKRSRIVLHPRTRARRDKAMKGDPVTWYDLPLEESYLDAIRSSGTRIRHISTWLNAVSVLATREELERISQLTPVRSIQPVRTYRRRILPHQPLPDRSFKRKSTALDYGYSSEQIEQINVHKAHQAGYSGEGVRILVMDTGFYLEHPVFDSLNLVAQWDVIENDSVTANQVSQDSVYYPQMTQHDHGTMVLSTLAGYDPGNLIGPAYRSEFLLAKTEILQEEIILEEDNYVAGLEWGEALGAEVVTTSLGYLDWYTYQDMDGNSAVTTRAVDIAAALGVVCVTAAGNEAACGEPGEDCWYYIIAPADADSVIAVGAVDREGVLASFSSRGPTADGRIKPEVCARGVVTACANPDLAVSAYRWANGTSLATPLVSGAAALILDANPGWTPMMVREALLFTANQAPQPDNDYGYGVIDVWAALNYGAFSDLQPGQFQITTAYPNPFNHRIQFKIVIPASGRVDFTIHDLQGRTVARLFSGYRYAGPYLLEWSPGNLASGIYLARLVGGSHSTARKVTYLK